MYHEAAQSKSKQTNEQKIEQFKTALSATEKEITSRRNYHQFLEMQEIFFNCSINANPQAHLVHWFFNGKALQTDLSKGKFASSKEPLGDGYHFSPPPHSELFCLI